MEPPRLGLPGLRAWDLLLGQTRGWGYRGLCSLARLFCWCLEDPRLSAQEADGLSNHPGGFEVPTADFGPGCGCKTVTWCHVAPIACVIEEACIDLTLEASSLGEVKKDDLNSESALNSNSSD